MKLASASSSMSKTLREGTSWYSDRANTIYPWKNSPDLRITLLLFWRGRSLPTHLGVFRHPREEVEKKCLLKCPCSRIMFPLYQAYHFPTHCTKYGKKLRCLPICQPHYQNSKNKHAPFFEMPGTRPMCRRFAHFLKASWLNFIYFFLIR